MTATDDEEPEFTRDEDVIDIEEPEAVVTTMLSPPSSWANTFAEGEMQFKREAEHSFVVASLFCFYSAEHETFYMGLHKYLHVHLYQL